MFLAQKKILALDLSLIVAGTKYRGQFEERLKGIIRELRENPDLIIFIDEIHSLIGAGSAEGSLDAANILKPALSRGEVSCIGATTLKEYRKYIEKDRSLLRRFQAIHVTAPSENETFEILEGVKDRYEQFHKVRYSAEAIKTPVYQSNRYITDRFFPDKAIDILDEAGAKVKLKRVADTQNLRKLELEIRQIVKEMKKAISDKDFEKGVFLREREIELKEEIERAKAQSAERSEATQEVTRRDIEEIISSWTGIPVASLEMEEAEKLLHMEDALRRRIVGQEAAIIGVSKAIRRSRLGVNNPEPADGLLHLPRAVGRRQDRGRAAAGGVPLREPEVARPLRHVRVHGEARRLQADRLASRLRRARGGRPAHGADSPQSLQRDPVRRDREGAPGHREPAPPDPGGRHPHGRLRQPRRLQEHADHHDVQHRDEAPREPHPVGFGGSKEAQSSKEIEDLVLKELRRDFSPEFINRIDDIIVFHPLGRAELARICRLLIDDVNATIAPKGATIDVDDAAVEWLLAQSGEDPNMGARPLRRAIQKHVEDPVSELLIAAREERIEAIDVRVGADGLRVYAREGEPISPGR
jgi:ATP-dependent Clp protease ATP-binding subunit ClpC